MEKSLSYRKFELPRVKLYENYMENDLKGIENYFELRFEVRLIEGSSNRESTAVRVVFKPR